MAAHKVGGETGQRSKETAEACTDKESRNNFATFKAGTKGQGGKNDF